MRGSYLGMAGPVFGVRQGYCRGVARVWPVYGRGMQWYGRDIAKTCPGMAGVCPGCYLAKARLFPGCDLAKARLFPGCDWGLAGVCPGCDWVVSGVWPGCILVVARV